MNHVKPRIGYAFPKVFMDGCHRSFQRSCLGTERWFLSSVRFYLQLLQLKTSATLLISITGAFVELGSVAEREVPCYLPRSFYIKWTSSSSKKIGGKRLLKILTHSVTGRTQELLLKNTCHVRSVANSISATKFHLRKPSKWRKY